MLTLAECPDCGRTVIADAGLYTKHARMTTDRKNVTCTGSNMPLMTETRILHPNDPLPKSAKEP